MGGRYLWGRPGVWVVRGAAQGGVLYVRQLNMFTGRNLIAGSTTRSAEVGERGDTRGPETELFSTPFECSFACTVATP